MGEIKKLHGELADTLEDVERVRQIRNECRLYMTRNQEHISSRQQLRWWMNFDETTTRLYVFRQAYTVADGCGGFGPVVGYGLCRLIDGRWWLTGALTGLARGEGLGEQLFRFLIKSCGNAPIGLEAREDNKRAVKLYQKLGFVEVSRANAVVTMHLEAAHASGQ